jgi:hypothetical protein
VTAQPLCWFARTLGPPAGACGGQLVKAHLVPKQAIRRERRDADLWDRRCWVPACGGLTGLGGHHGMFDSGRIAVPPEFLPVGLREYLHELELDWMIERYFGTGRALTVD